MDRSGDAARGGSALRLMPAAPARLLAVAVVAGAVALVLLGATRGAWERTPDDPIAPWIVAVVTLVGAAVLARRAWTQQVVIDDEGIVARNLTSTARLHWSTVEELRQVRRPGLVVLDVHLRGTRRRHRLGAATRWPGRPAEQVLDELGRHPWAAALLVRAES